MQYASFLPWLFSLQHIFAFFFFFFFFFTERLIQVAPVWLVLKFIDNMAMVHLAYNYVEENKFIDRQAGFHYDLCDCRIFSLRLALNASKWGAWHPG